MMQDELGHETLADVGQAVALQCLVSAEPLTAMSWVQMLVKRRRRAAADLFPHIAGHPVQGQRQQWQVPRYMLTSRAGGQVRRPQPAALVSDGRAAMAAGAVSPAPGALADRPPAVHR